MPERGRRDARFLALNRMPDSRVRTVAGPFAFARLHTATVAAAVPNVGAGLSQDIGTPRPGSC